MHKEKSEVIHPKLRKMVLSGKKKEVTGIGGGVQRILSPLSVMLSFFTKILYNFVLLYKVNF